MFIIKSNFRLFCALADIKKKGSARLRRTFFFSFVCFFLRHFRAAESRRSLRRGDLAADGVAVDLRFDGQGDRRGRFQKQFAVRESPARNRDCALRRFDGSGDFRSRLRQVERQRDGLPARVDGNRPFAAQVRAGRRRRLHGRLVRRVCRAARGASGFENLKARRDGAAREIIVRQIRVRRFQIRVEND